MWMALLYLLISTALPVNGTSPSVSSTALSVDEYFSVCNLQCYICEWALLPILKVHKIEIFLSSILKSVIFLY